MTAKVYGIKNCDTMKKAFAWLDAHGVEYDFHDYKKSGVPPGKLKAWAMQASWEALANTSAIRRPIVEVAGKLLVGFDPEEFARALKSCASSWPHRGPRARCAGRSSRPMPSR
ncbi:MAG: ArsC/Spx/MgsR family protein [Sphingomonadaceae bacterium]